MTMEPDQSEAPSPPLPSNHPRPPPIIWVGGSKGGVGKSTVTMFVLHQLMVASRPSLLVECDTSNPDVFKAHSVLVPSETVDLDSADGWIRLVNLCDEHRGSSVVVSTASRNNEAVTRFGRTLSDALPELNRELLVLWVINRQRDSLELLKQYMEAQPEARIVVVRNGYFGEQEKFQLFNGSKLREAVLAQGGREITFPDLADRVADSLFSKRLPLGLASKELDLGSRMELSRWIAECGRSLAGIIP